jgi:phosphoglycolate phosphatase
MTKLVIFDLDGTLLDTRADIADACNYALRMCGCPERKLEEYNMLVGRGILNLFRGALPEGRKDEETVMKMKEHFVPYYNAHIDNLTRPYDGIMEMLDAIVREGIHLAIASNKYQEGTETLVRKYFGAYGFVCILGQREGKPIKPDPEIIIEAMESLPGTTTAEVVYCGDSDVDMQTGINAGVRTIGVEWGFRTKEELSAYNPWLMVESPDEIVQAIVCDLE